MKKIFYMCDILSQKPELKIDGESRHATTIGSILSIMTYLMILTVSAYFSYILLNRLDMSVTYYVSPVKLPEFEISMMPWAFMVSSRLGQPLVNTSRYFTIQSLRYDFKYQAGVGDIANITPVPIERCNLTTNLLGYENYFNEVPFLDYHYCLPVNQSVKIKGAYAEVPAFSFFANFILRCRNNSALNKTDCYENSKIDTYLDSTNFLIKFIDYTFNSNVNEPGQAYLRSEAFVLNPNLQKRVVFNIRSVDYTTDYGFVFESLESNTYYTIGDARETIDTSLLLGRIASIHFTMDPKKDFYKRSYMKVQTLLANVGGVIKSLLVISKIFSYLFTKELYFLELVSSLFILDESDLVIKNKLLPNFNNQKPENNINIIKFKNKNTIVSLNL